MFIEMPEDRQHRDARVVRRIPSGKAITSQQAVIIAVVTIIAAAAGVYLAFRPGSAPIPGEFELNGLVIDPTEVDEGDSVVISVDIKNVGETDVTKLITLKLNDTFEDSKEITLIGEKTTTVTFTVTKDSGNYSVAIGELTGTFTVRRKWDIVIFGDSSAWGFGVYYAAYIEEDLGVKVTVHERAVGEQTAFGLLGKLRDDEELRELVSEAEVVTFIGNPKESKSETNPWDYRCAEAAGYHVINCSLVTFEKYIADIEAIIEEILSLRDGSPTIIRAMDCYSPNVRWHKEYGVYEECKQCIENTNIAIHQAATAHNIPVARVYDAFNGPNHDEDPIDKGYLCPDGIHTSEEGKKIIAKLFHELGYEPVNP
jgi:hypothetical protein